MKLHAWWRKPRVLPSREEMAEGWEPERRFFLPPHLARTAAEIEGLGGEAVEALRASRCGGDWPARWRRYWERPGQWGAWRDELLDVLRLAEEPGMSIGTALLVLEGEREQREENYFEEVL